MKFVRLVLGILAMAGSCFMVRVIYSLLKEHHDSRYIASDEWENDQF